MFERGATEARINHDETRVEAQRAEREVAALSQRYAEYAAGIVVRRLGQTGASDETGDLSRRVSALPDRSEPTPARGT
jgi:hypothetical protein